MKVLFLVIVILGLSSCSFYPRHRHADVDIPEDWRLPAGDFDNIANLQWWQLFEDSILDALIREALANNRDLKAAVARVYQYYALFAVEGSALFPTVNLEASAIRQKNPLPLEFPQIGRFNDIFTVSLNLAYEIDFWGRIRNLTEAAYYDYLAQEKAYRRVILILVSNLATTYVRLRQYDKQWEIAKRTVESRKVSLEIARLRFEGGLTSEIEVKQAQSELEIAIVRVKQLEILIPRQENQISVLIGTAPTDIIRGKRLEDLSLPPCVPAGLPCHLLKQRPDIMEAQYNLQAALHRFGAAQAEFFPKISLTGMYGSQSFELKELFSGGAEMWSYGVNLFQPIFDAGRIYFRNQAVDAFSWQKMAEYEQIILVALREVNDALIAHKKNLELVEVQKRRVEALQGYRNLAQIQYDNGQVDYLNILDAERSLFDAELDYVASQSESFVTLINLYRSLGGGWDIPVIPTCQ